MKIYLAIPYSGIEEQSFAVANAIAAILMKEGNIVYSPISHNHPIAMAHGLPTGWEYWEKFDTEFVKWCDAVYVVDLLDKGSERIEKSKGVQAEIKLAKELGKKIYLIQQGIAISEKLNYYYL